MMRRRYRRPISRIRQLKRGIGRLKSSLSNSWIWRLIRSLFNLTTVWLALVLFVLSGSIVGLYFWGWEWLHFSPSGEQLEVATESRSTTIRNVGFVIAGALALVFAVWRSVVAQRQSETSQQGLLNERYQKGADMLGSDVLAVRLGGIYALQRLAEERPKQYHLQIMELLCAFVRFPTYDKMIDSSFRVVEEQDRESQTLRPDIQDTMRFLGSRSREGIGLERRENRKLYLRDANVSNLQTLRSNLSWAWLTNANLSNARLRRIDLSNARLRKAILHRSILRGANLSGAMLQDTNLSDASLFSADLSDANLESADLSRTEFAAADLTNADLTDAVLTGASFSRRGRRGNPRLPAKGLTQAQLDEASSNPDNPPNLEGVLDAETGEQLVWRVKPVDDDPIDAYV